MCINPVRSESFWWYNFACSGQTTTAIIQQSSVYILYVFEHAVVCVIISCDGFYSWASQSDSFVENFLEAHWPPNRSTLAAPGEVAAAVLVGGARETPGSAAAGVGDAAAREGVGSAARVGSDSKESPISSSTSRGVWNPHRKEAK